MDPLFPPMLNIWNMSEESVLNILRLYDEHIPHTKGCVNTVTLGVRCGAPYLNISKVNSYSIEKGMGMMGRMASSSTVWWISTPVGVEIYKPIKIGTLIAVRRTEPEREEMVFYSYRDWMRCFGVCLIGDGANSGEDSDEYESDSLSEREDEGWG